MTVKAKSNIGNNQINKVNKNNKKNLAIKKNLKNKMVQEKNGGVQKKMKAKKHVPTPNQKEKLMESDNLEDESEDSDDDMEASDDEDVKNESIEASADDDSGEDNENENDGKTKNSVKKQKPEEISGHSEYNMSYNERSIGISNLKGNITINQIKAIFKNVKNGEIEKIYLKTSNHEPLEENEAKDTEHGFLAFVRFINKDGAKNAIKLNGTLLNNRHLYIYLIDVKSRKPETQEECDELNDSTIKIENLDINSDEEKLYKIFESSCGEINYVKLTRRKDVCLGHIVFKKSQSAKTALELKTITCDGKKITISKARTVYFLNKPKSVKKMINNNKWKKNREHGKRNHKGQKKQNKPFVGKKAKKTKVVASDSTQKK